MGHERVTRRQTHRQERDHDDHQCVCVLWFTRARLNWQGGRRKEKAPLATNNTINHKHYDEYSMHPLVCGGCIKSSCKNAKRACPRHYCTACNNGAAALTVLAAAHAVASSRPRRTLTRSRTGTGKASITSRKTNPRRILPVISAITPTTAGPMKDADLSVREKREKKVDSWP